jgi:hypothetical protein
MVRRMVRELPPGFLSGIDGVEVTGKSVPHPVRAGVYTLGECIPQAFGGPLEESAALRSRVELHYGSFRALAAEHPGFDWREEAWETLTHEVRHHLEWRARQADLEALDAAAEANYARHDGEPFPALFHLSGERLAPGVSRVEDDVFVDVMLPARQWRQAAGSEHRFEWHGGSWRVRLPQSLPDVLYLTVTGVTPEPAGDLVLVIRRRPGARDLLRRTAVGTATARALTSGASR